MSGIVVGFAAGLFILAYLLWSDRHRLIDANEPSRRIKHVGLLLIMALLMSGTAYLVAVNWPAVPNNTAQSPTGKLELDCTKSPKQKGNQKDILHCEGTAPTTSQSGQEAKDPLSGKLEVVFAGLGIFIALVTAISLAVAKNATDEAHRSEEQIKELRKELDYISQAQLLAVRLSLQNVEIHTVTQLARSSLLQSKLGINPTPLLEAKLKVMEEMLHWEAPEFDADGLTDRIDTLLDMMDNNPNYRPHLKAFFNERDIAACTELIEILRKPVNGVLLPKQQQADQTICRLLRKLRTI